MRRGRRFATIAFNALFLACSLALVVALAFTGAGLLAIVSVFAAILVFYSLPFIPAVPAPVFVRRLSRRSFPRAPPRF